MTFLIRRLALPAMGVSLLLAGCASSAPPLSFYTLGTPNGPAAASLPSLSAHTPTVQIARVVLPDYMDTQDMVLRDQEKIVRSDKGRWATRLSVGVTDLITNQIALSHPDELITDQPVPEAATWRVQINISRFDIDTHGQAVLDANWSVLPADMKQPIVKQRAHIVTSGSVNSDANVASLMRKLVVILAGQINSSLPS